MLQPVDLLITGGTILTMDSQRRLIPNGAVAIRGSQIVHTGPAQEVAAQVQPAETIDAAGQLVIPGLVNTHSHLAMTIFRGVNDDKPLENWLGSIWKLEAVFCTSANVRLGAQLAIIESIRSGATCAHDMYWQLHTNTEAAVEAGFRMINGPTFTEIVGPDGEQPENREPAARFYIEKYAAHPLVHPCIQVHSTYTTTLEMLQRAQRVAAEYGLPFITHASESKFEVDTALQRFGKTPIEYLHSLDLLGPRTLLAHCVHLTDAEVALLAGTGTSVAHCPESNLKVGNGIARVPYLLSQGVNVALGTDGAASNNDLDLFGEMHTAALLHKGNQMDPTLLPAEQVFAMATCRAAAAVGLGERLGSIEPGKLADIAILDLDRPHLTPLYNVYSHLVYAAKSTDVRTVLINGKLVMRDRRLLTLDEAAVMEAVNRLSRDIWLALQNN